MLRRIGLKRRKAREKSETIYDEDYYLVSQWQLMWRKFRRHRLAIPSLAVILFLYSLAIFPEFFAINDYQKRHASYAKAPPHTLHFVDEEGQFHPVPFIYELKQELDMSTLARHYTEDTSKRYYLKFFVEGEPYQLLGLFDTSIHLVGVDAPAVSSPSALTNSGAISIRGRFMPRGLRFRLAWLARRSAFVSAVSSVASPVISAGGLTWEFND